MAPKRGFFIEWFENGAYGASFSGQRDPKRPSVTRCHAIPTREGMPNGKNGRLLSAHSLKTEGFNDRVVALLTGAPQVGETTPQKQARDLAKYLVHELDFGSGVVNKLTEPAVVEGLLKALLGG